MIAWGTFPDWITAVATAGSFCFLIDYAVSARKQVTASQRQVRVSQKQLEASIRPVIVIVEDRSARGWVFVFKNLGPGPALNVKWIFASEVAERRDKYMSAVAVDQSEPMGNYDHFVLLPDDFKVWYESPSGTRYVTEGILVNREDGAVPPARMEYRIRQLKLFTV